MPKIKILFISHSPHLYGAEKCLLTLVQHLDREVFEPVVVLPAEGLLKEKLDLLGVRSCLYRAEWWARNENHLVLGEGDVNARIQALVEIINREQPTIVHSNTSVILDGAIAAKMTGTKHVWHIHEMFRGHPSLDPILPLPLLYKAIDILSEKVVAVSDQERAELAEFVTTEKMLTIHNGIDAASFKTTADQSLRRELGIKKSDIVVLTVASFRKYKGLDTLIEAAAIVRKSSSNVRFVVAGSGTRESAEELKEQANRLQLTDHIHFLGHREDVPGLLAGADLLALPSRKEAFPLVVLEAMASGRPIVATNCGGIAEMIVDGESGFIVPVDDPASMADRILEASANQIRMVDMGKNALKRFSENFRSEAYVGNFEKLYKEIAGLEKHPGFTGNEAVFFRAFLEAYQSYVDTMKAVVERDSQLSEQGQLISDRDILLKGQEKRIVELNQSLEARDGQIQEYGNKLVERDEKIAQLGQWLAERERDVLDHSRWLDEKNRAIRERDQLLTEKSLNIKGFELLLAERSQQIEQLNKTLTDRDEQVRKLVEDRDEQVRKLVEDRDEQVRKLEKDRDEQVRKLEKDRDEQVRKLVEDRDEQVRKLVEDRDKQARKFAEDLGGVAQRLDLLETRLQEKSVELAIRDERIEQLGRELALASEQRADLESRLAAKASDLAERDERLLQIEEEVAREARRVEERLARLGEEREVERQGFDRRLREKEQLLRQKENLAREKEQRIYDLLNSKSWKVTAPLRKVLDLFAGKQG
jgi:glycosyltransferase involved in cell wall biosynthesis